MAKVVVTVEDVQNGVVNVQVHPSFKTMATIMREGRGLTAAHRVTMFALQAMKRAAVDPKILKEQGKLILPPTA